MPGISPDTPVLGGLFGQAQTGSSGPYVEFYQNMADGTHLVRQSLDPTTHKMVGQATDEGVIASKAAPTDKPVVKTLSDGSTWAFKFNSDGTVAQSTELNAAQEKPGQQSLDTLRSAQTDMYRQKLADAEAMAPYAPQKAAAQIQLLQAQAAKDTQLLPDQKALIDARVSRIASQNAVDTSRIGLNNANAGKAGAQTDLYTAEAQAKLKSSFFQAKNEVDQILASVGTPGGPTQDEANALVQQVYDRAAREAATGISASQDAANQLTAQRQAMEQGNNRASEAGSDFRSMMTTAADLGKNGGSAADIGNYLSGAMGLAPSFMASMGGAPVSINSPVTAQHAAEIRQLVTSEAVPPDANGNRFSNAVKAVAAKYGVPVGYAASPNGGVAGAPGTPDSVLSLGGAGLAPAGQQTPPATTDGTGFLSNMGNQPPVLAPV